MKKLHGFTLIELMVVITIMTILIGVGMVSYQKTTKLSRDAKRKTDLEQIRQALETYRAEKSVYPPAVNDSPTALVSDFISTLPVDPKGVKPYTYTPGNPATTYTLCAWLELGTSGGTSCDWQVKNP